MAPARSTFGAVSFGNSSTPRYRGGEAAGLIPIDPESLAIDGEKLAAKAVEHEGEKKPSTSPAASAYDGLVRNADGTYTAVETYTGAEVKSGTAALSPSQRAFDGAVDSGQPATATLDGRPIQITRTVLVRVRP